MAGERKYTRIPPESTGDRILLNHSAVIPYVSLENSHKWVTNEDYWINNASPVLVHLHQVIEETATTGSLYFHYSATDDNNGVTATVGVKIQDFNNVDVATVSAGEYSLYTNTTNLVGHNNPRYGASVDRFGSVNTRFAEGPPEISAFGGLRTAHHVLLAQYSFSKSALTDEFVNSQEGTGTKTWIPGSIRMQVEGTIGDRVTNTSNIFHPYIPGTSTLFVFAARLGDNTIPGLARNWGPFDATDGFFFQQNGTKLRIIHRWTINAPTSSHLVEQGNWNIDTLDGSSDPDKNPSGMLIDVTATNTYWVDFQFIGGGRTRWGVFYKGERLVCHEMYHGNAESGAMTADGNPISNPNRPLCWAIANIATDADGNNPNAAPAIMHALGGAVYLESDIDPFVESSLHSYARSPYTIAAANTSTNYAFTLSPRSYNPAGLAYLGLTAAQAEADSSNTEVAVHENHTLYSPTIIDVSSYDSADDDVDRKVEVRIFAKCIMRGVSWSDVEFSTVEVDVDGDHLSHGPEIARYVIKGHDRFNFNTILSTIQNGTVKNGGDQSFARDSQPLASIDGQLDEEGTGVTSIVIQVKDHPVWQNNKHFFEDRGFVNFRGLDGTETLTGTGVSGSSLKTADGTGYYLSLLSSNKAWIYNALADIDDDRNARIVALDNVTGLDIGDDINITAHNSFARVIAIDGFNVTVGGRDKIIFDVGTTGAVTWPGGSGTISGITLSGVGTYPMDYRTSLLAANAEGISPQNSIVLDQNVLYGKPPHRIAWTFMVRHLQAKSSNTATRWFINWKERIQ
jgi:hypothetical protein